MSMKYKEVNIMINIDALKIGSKIYEAVYFGDKIDIRELVVAEDTSDKPYCSFTILEGTKRNIPKAILKSGKDVYYNEDEDIYTFNATFAETPEEAYDIMYQLLIDDAIDEVERATEYFNEILRLKRE